MPANFSTNDKFDAKKGYTDVRFGSDTKLLEVELNELQKIQNYARAELMRQSTHSGLLSGGGMRINSANTVINGFQLYSKGNPSTNIAGVLQLGSKNDYVALINGHIIDMGGGYGTTDQTLIQIDLPAPPTFGIREDLVFLEAWFEEIDYTKDAAIQDSRYGVETSRRTKLNWRIRTVAGVDFSTYPLDGFAKAVNSGGADLNRVTTAQGGNSSPLTYESSWDSFRAANNTLGTVNWRFSDDAGLYVSGNPTDSSKSRLKTADGYVYAIPLFRVKRRNSGGYREDNVNGARDYIKPAFTRGATISKVGETAQYTLSADDYTKVSVGDVFRHPTTVGYGFTIITKDGSNTVTVRNDFDTILGGSTTNSEYYRISDRIDGKFANIIDKDDIIDLRHKVSLTGFNYQQLLEENFGKLLTGELQTKDKPVMVKERFGLTPAPVGTPVNLVPTKVLGNDGVERDLVNVLGTEGNFESDIWNLQNSVSGGTITLDTNVKAHGTASYKHVASSSNTWKYKDISGLESTKYYVALLDIHVSAITTGSFRIALYESGSFNTLIGISASPGVNSKFETRYVKFTGKSAIRFAFGNGTTTTGTAYYDGARLIEVDQATYDKIDVDPLFTGEELAKKFPYVPSYPNVVENLFDINNIESGVYNNSGIGLAVNPGTSSTRVRTKNPFPVSPNKEYKFSAPTGYDLYLLELDSSNNLTAYTGYTSGYFTKTMNSATTKLHVLIRKTGDATIAVSDVLGLPFYITASHPLYVPYGKWFLPTDYANNDTPTRLVDITDHRQVFSDAQMTDVRSELVEALKTPQKNVKVMQAVEGQWAVNDTIKVSSQDGIVGGLIDADTALASATEGLSVTGGLKSGKVKVSSVSGFSVNDRVYIQRGWSTNFEAIVTEVDSANSAITIDTTTTINAGFEIRLGDTFYEITASTSSPVVEALVVDNKVAQAGTSSSITLASDASSVTDYYKDMYVYLHTSGQKRKITAYNGTTKVATVDSNWNAPNNTSTYRISQEVGTWSGLGTKEATYTITSAPVVTNADIKIDYAVHYPAGKGINSLPTEVLGAKVNGLSYVKSNTLTLRANFVDKVSGNTDVNPHSSHRTGTNSATSIAQVTPATSLMEVTYSFIDKLDGSTGLISTNVSGANAIYRFSFNLIEMYERSYGRIPGLTTADKVAWLKANVVKIHCSWYGRGNSPIGYKATLSRWLGSAWQGTSNFNATESISKVTQTFTLSEISGSAIDANGFSHFLAYAEPANGVTTDLNGGNSTLETDYAELDVEINVTETGYDVYVPEEPKPVISPNLLSHGQSLPIDVGSFSPVSTIYSTLSIPEHGVLRVDSTDTNNNATYSGMYFTRGWSSNIDEVTAIVMFKGVAGRSYRILFNHPTEGASTIKTFTATGDWQRVEHCAKSATQRYLRIDTAFDTADTFYIGRSMLVAGNQEGKNVQWSLGRKSFQRMNFLGKVGGDTFSNPHRLLRRTAPSFADPSMASTLVGVLEATQGHYTNTGKQDGVLSTISVPIGGNGYPQYMFEFDLAHLGLSLKELKATFRKLTATIVGYGVGDNAGALGYGLQSKLWNATTNAWVDTSSNTSSTPTSIVPNSSSYNYITKDQKIYILAHATYPASATIASEVFIDYVKLEIELADYVDQVKKNVVKVRKETKEVKFQYPPKSEVNGMKDAVELFYRTIPKQSYAPVGGDLLLLGSSVFVTSEGTGKAINQSLSRLEIGSPISQLDLPSNAKESDFIRERMYFGNGYGNPSFLAPATPSGAYTVSLAFTPYTTYKGSGGMMNSFSFMIPKLSEGVIPSSILLAYTSLVLINGELYLRIATSKVADTARMANQWLSHGGNVAYADYKLQGRPLMK